MTNERRFMSSSNDGLTVCASNYDMYLDNLFEMFGDFEDDENAIPQEFINECRKRTEVTINSYEEAIEHFDNFLHFAADFFKEYKFPEESEYYEEDRQALICIYEVFFNVIDKLKNKEECDFILEGEKYHLRFVD